MKIVNEACAINLLKGLTREQCLQLLNELHQKLSDCSAEELALSQTPGLPQTIFQPLRINITTRNQDTTLVMPASDTKTTCVKVLTAPSTGNLTAMLSFFDPEGTPLGILSATTLTPFRTALTVMILFTKYLGSKKNIVIFGAGRQVEWHIRLAILLHDDGEIENITVVNRSHAKALALVAQLRQEYPQIDFESRALDGVDGRLLHSADAIFTCTPSRDPLFPHNFLDANKHYFISLIGSYMPVMHEIDEPTLLSGLSQNDRIFVDSISACLEESGELIDAKIKPSQLTELGELPMDFELKAPERGNVILKAVGMGIMDLLTGKSLLEIAEHEGQGANIEW